MNKIFTCQFTDRSLKKHNPVNLKYTIWSASSDKPVAINDKEYMPQEKKAIEIPQIDARDIFKENKPIKILIFIGTYSCLQYIDRIINQAQEQLKFFPSNWHCEILVVLNGVNQKKEWEHLCGIREKFPNLSLAYLPREENPGMYQSKINPLNLALNYANKNQFDVLGIQDDDVKLSEGNFLEGIETLISESLKDPNLPTIITGKKIIKNQPTVIGTLYYHYYLYTQIHSFKGNSGPNAFMLVKRTPLLPVDAGNEDYLLAKIFQEQNFKFKNTENAFFEWVPPNNLKSSLTQLWRWKKNDAAANQYVSNPPNLISSLIRLIKIFGKYDRKLDKPKTYLYAIVYSILALSCRYGVAITILFRNIFNLPQDQINWVDTVPPESKV